MTTRRLYRSRDRQLAGVAGGMAEYLDIDPTIVRILWIIGALFSGGLLILGYIILAFVIPEAPYGVPGQGWTAPAAPAAQGWTAPAAPAGSAPGYQAPSSAYAAPAAAAWSPDWAAQAAAEREARERARGRGPGAAVVVGTVLIVFGGIALANSMLPAWAGAVVLGPALVIALGAALLVASVRRRDEAPAAAPAAYAAPAAAAAPAQPVQAAQAFDAQAFDAAMAAPATGTGYDADATSPVDLGTAEPTDPYRETETK